MYVESKHRKLFIYTKDMTYEYYCRLDDLEKELSGEPFIRCHQSYLVAIAYITNYENDDVYIDEKPIPVSRRYRHMVQSVIYQAELFGEASSHVFVKDNIHSISKAKTSYEMKRQAFASERLIQASQRIGIALDSMAED